MYMQSVQWTMWWWISVLMVFLGILKINISMEHDDIISTVACLRVSQILQNRFCPNLFLVPAAPAVDTKRIDLCTHPLKNFPLRSDLGKQHWLGPKKTFSCCLMGRTMQTFISVNKRIPDKILHCLAETFNGTSGQKQNHGQMGTF